MSLPAARGDERIRYTNHSPDTLPMFALHLHLNHFCQIAVEALLAHRVVRSVELPIGITGHMSFRAPHVRMTAGCQPTDPSLISSRSTAAF
jgi:hypothetical protein